MTPRGHRHVAIAEALGGTPGRLILGESPRIPWGWRPCPHCSDGRVYTVDGWSDCGSCHGLGYAPRNFSELGPDDTLRLIARALTTLEAGPAGELGEALLLILAQWVDQCVQRSPTRRPLDCAQGIVDAIADACTGQPRKGAGS